MMNENVKTFVLLGNWFSENTSACLAAELHVDSLALVRVISVTDSTLLHTCRLADINVSSRIGDATHNFLFGNGERFETQDNAQVNLLLKIYGTSLWGDVAHLLKSHIYFICVNLLLVIGLSWASMKYAIPAASKVIANQLPQTMLDSTSTETLQLLDKIYLQPTELDEGVQARVVQHLAPALKENAHLQVRVIFRGGGDLGANAFALPNGTIIFTDEMVKLAKNDDELIAVLVHEIGHVKYRHGLRSVIESSSLGSIVGMLMGDTSAASRLITAVPVILITMPYSHDFEREADQSALEYLNAKNIQRHVFIELMERVTYEARCDFLLRIEPLRKEPLRKALHGINEEVISDGEEIYSSTLASAAASSVSKKSLTGKGPIIKDFKYKSPFKTKDKIAAEPEEAITVKTEEAITVRTDEAITVKIEDQIAARKIQCDNLMATHDFEKETIKAYSSTHPGTNERSQKFK